MYPVNYIDLLYRLIYVFLTQIQGFFCKKLLTKPFLQKDLNCHSGVSWFASALEIWGVEIKSGSDF